jgi:hypothetical protein
MAKAAHTAKKTATTRKRRERKNVKRERHIVPPLTIHRDITDTAGTPYPGLLGGTGFR